MEVKILSRETIKPASPTPSHLRTHKLSLLDQRTPPISIPVILFYSAATDEIDPTQKSDHLKDSLSQCLTHYYPLAGKLNNGDLTIDSNDDGATFIEAQVGGDMSFVLEDQAENIEVLQQLLPLPKPQPGTDHPIILAVQVNYFACGGMAIGVRINHMVADGSAVANFLKTWAAIALGKTSSSSTDNIDGVICDCSALFPPIQDFSIVFKYSSRILSANVEKESSKDNYKIVTNRFLFAGSKISALRNEMEDDHIGLDYSYRPTRLEAVTALVWEALIVAAAENHKTLAATYAVNMRNRIKPPLPQHCIGNVFFPIIITSFKDEKKIITDRISLAKKIHESVKEIDDGFIKRTFTSDECYNNFLEKVCYEFDKNPKMGVCFFSSWCKLPIYETDFGWGKPVWVAVAFRNARLGVFLDASDGEGIEAWITLKEEEMARFEKQPGILAYASFKSGK